MKPGWLPRRLEAEAAHAAGGTLGGARRLLAVDRLRRRRVGRLLRAEIEQSHGSGAVPAGRNRDCSGRKKEGRDRSRPSSAPGRADQGYGVRSSTLVSVMADERTAARCVRPMRREDHCLACISVASPAGSPYGSNSVPCDAVPVEDAVAASAGTPRDCRCVMSSNFVKPPASDQPVGRTVRHDRVADHFCQVQRVHRLRVQRCG